jgi:hypothetical protein
MSTPSTPVRHLPGLLATSGGVLFAAGNVLHPLEHSHAAHQAVTWEAAHLVFAAGGLLLAAGLPLLVETGDVIRRSRLASIAAVVLAVCFAGLAPGAWFEAFIAPLPGGVAETVEAGTAGSINTAIGFAWILGTLAFGIAMARGGMYRTVQWAGSALIAGAVVLVAGPGIPVAEGLWIIPASVLVGGALAVAGVMSSCRPAATATEPLTLTANP